MSTRRNATVSPANGAPRGTLNEARWGEILQAAAEVFEERGFKAARLQDIAGRVGLLTASLYYYIESKEDLLFAIVESSHRQGLGTTEEDPAMAAADAPARLRAFIQRWMHMLENQSGPMGLVERDLPYLADEHRARVESMRHHLHGFVRGVIERGVAEGAFDPAVDAGVATNTLFQLLTTTSRWASRTGRLTYADIGDWYARLMLGGLANQRSSLADSGVGPDGSESGAPSPRRARREKSTGLRSTRQR